MLYPELFHHFTFGPYTSTEDFVKNFYEPRIAKDSGSTLFAIFDKTKQNTELKNNHPHQVPEEESPNDVLAGIIGLINSSLINLTTEIGYVFILPSFQRTHIASNATGLLLQHTLNLPSESPPGLGLRRVVWQAYALNKASVGLAERMGFRLEGVLRWGRALPPWKKEMGRISREGDPRRDCFGIDTALLALCWEDWEDGGRDKVKLVMQRVK